MAITDTQMYRVVAEDFRPHMRAAAIAAYMQHSGGEYPAPARLEYVVDSVMSVIKAEIERVEELNLKLAEEQKHDPSVELLRPNVAVPALVARIRQTIATEFADDFKAKPDVSQPRWRRPNATS